MLRIKHYNPRLLGWEEKDESTEFVLVQLGAQEAVFLQRKVKKQSAPWTIYRLQNQRIVIAYFEVESEPVSDKFVYNR